MPIAKLEFNLPEENEEFKDAVNGTKYHIALDEVYNKFRSLAKYTDTQPESWDQVREIFNQVLLDCGVEI